VTSTPTTPNDPDDTMKVSEAMERLGYVDRKSFLAMARSKGLPLVYLNTRVIRIRRVDFSTWLRRRAA
jgi:hypothetical protein